MSAEELKAAVREYAEEHHSQSWDVASICVSRGAGNEPETLIVTPATPRPSIHDRSLPLQADTGQ